MTFVFVEFQKAMLQGNCEKLVGLSSFPIEGDAGLYRLIDEDEPWAKMEKYNYEIPKELLLENCKLLDSVELLVLKQFDFTTLESDTGILFDNCIYKANIYLAEDKSYFHWSVGCVELKDQDIGEYSMIFTFRLIDGEYRLKVIHGAG
jgi:hypothetical protein